MFICLLVGVVRLLAHIQDLFTWFDSMGLLLVPDKIYLHGSIPWQFMQPGLPPVRRRTQDSQDRTHQDCPEEFPQSCSKCLIQLREASHADREDVGERGPQADEASGRGRRVH
jgi:hypothetical protein